MPWWAIIYLVVFVAFSIVGDTIGEFDGTRKLHWLAQVLTDATFAIFFLGFWLSSIYSALGLLAPILLLAAVGWELFSAPGDLREVWRDPEFSRKERLAMTLLPPLLFWPLQVTAGVGVWRFYART